jgi:CubicO group peptidase (beta-lactamase class C family)
VVALSAAAGLFAAQQPDLSPLAERIEAAMRDLEAPAVAIAVVAGERVIYEKAFGYRDRERRLPATVGTSFYIASSTKSFTALAARLLAADGKLNLDAPLDKVLPMLRLPPPLAADRMAVRDLLTHRLGFENDAVVHRTAYSGDFTDAQIWALLERSRVQP